MFHQVLHSPTQPRNILLSPVFEVSLSCKKYEHCEIYKVSSQFLNNFKDIINKTSGSDWSEKVPL